MSDTSTKNHAGPFGGLSAEEAARRSVASREAKKQLEPKERGNELLKELVQAAFGEGRWKKLSPDKQLSALIKANEYINGRPVSMKEAKGDEDEEENPNVFSITERKE